MKLIQISILLLLVGLFTSCSPLKQIQPAAANYLTANVWQVSHAGGSGSAFFVEKELLITNAHVVKNAYNITITNFRETLEFDIEVLNVDESKDLALLRCIGCEELYPYVAEISSTDPPIGSELYGGGYGLGRFQIHQGYVQGYTPVGRIRVSMNTIYGDSGSSAISVDNGKIKIQGVRSAVASYPIGFMGGGGSVAVTYMTILISPLTLREFINESFAEIFCFPPVGYLCEKE